MLCLSPTIWHFPPPSSLLSTPHLLSFLLSFLKSPSALSFSLSLCIFVNLGPPERPAEPTGLIKQQVSVAPFRDLLLSYRLILSVA